MMTSTNQPPAGHDTALQSAVGRHGLVFVAFVAISVMAIGSQVVSRPDVSGAAGTSSSSSLPNSDDPRSCTSTGTIFMDVKRPIDAINLFQQRMSEVVMEREQILRKVNQWECYGGPNGIQPPATPQLLALANDLPGWHYKYSTDIPGIGTQTIMVLKPVNFESFASIVSEFLREYECKLAQFQPESIYLARTDHDMDSAEGMANSPGGTYCCAEMSQQTSPAPPLQCLPTNAVDESGNTVTCASGKYSGPDPTCERDCTIKDYYGNLGLRATDNFNRMKQERIRARVAVERTINTLRSFELAVVFTVQMSCFQRAGLDIKNELGLLADGVSCMPKIWDSLNSLHDLKSQSPPEL